MGKSDRYYPIVINAADWYTKGKLSTLFVKQKAGHLSYLQDPSGLRSMSMQSGNVNDESFLKSIKLFSDDAMLISFAKYFCIFDDNDLFKRLYSDIAFSGKEEKSDFLPMYLKILRLIDSKGRVPRVIDVWDAKLLRTFVETRDVDLLNRELIFLLTETIDDCFRVNDSVLSSLTQSENWWEKDQSLGPLLVWSDVPIRCYCSYKHVGK